MELCDLLKIEKGVTAIIGSGGKTTLLHSLANELAGTVLLCTTTLIYPFDTVPTLISPTNEEIKFALGKTSAVCVGSYAEKGKIKASELSMETLAELVDYVLVEADGAKQMPLKAHLPHEPVIPKSANQTICVVGASGFGIPICEGVHRPEKFAELAEARLQGLATPENVAKVLAAEGLAGRIFINQVDTEHAIKNAKRLAQKLDRPVAAGSLKNKIYYKIKAR